MSASQAGLYELAHALMTVAVSGAGVYAASPSCTHCGASAVATSALCVEGLAALAAAAHSLVVTLHLAVALFWHGLHATADDTLVSHGTRSVRIGARGGGGGGAGPVSGLSLDAAEHISAVVSYLDATAAPVAVPSTPAGGSIRKGRAPEPAPSTPIRRSLKNERDVNSLALPASARPAAASSGADDAVLSSSLSLSFTPSMEVLSRTISMDRWVERTPTGGSSFYESDMQFFTPYGTPDVSMMGSAERPAPIVTALAAPQTPPRLSVVSSAVRLLEAGDACLAASHVVLMVSRAARRVIALHVRPAAALSSSRTLLVVPQPPCVMPRVFCVVLPRVCSEPRSAVSVRRRGVCVHTVAGVSQSRRHCVWSAGTRALVVRRCAAQPPAGVASVFAAGLLKVQW